jgi:hypothetical protein
MAAICLVFENKIEKYSVVRFHLQSEGTEPLNGQRFQSEGTEPLNGQRFPLPEKIDLSLPWLLESYQTIKKLSCNQFQCVLHCSALWEKEEAGFGIQEFENFGFYFCLRVLTLSLQMEE